MAKIGIILGSIRTGRKGEAVATWVAEHSRGRNHDYELVDLVDYPLPLLDVEVIPGDANKKYAYKEVQRWADKMDSFDGYIFVTAEYNSNIPGPFKNAFDHIYGEWKDKPVGFVAYSFRSGSGAIEGWRRSTSMMTAAQADTRISIKEYFDEETFVPAEEIAQQLENTLTEVESLLAAEK